MTEAAYYVSVHLTLGQRSKAFLLNPSQALPHNHAFLQTSPLRGTSVLLRMRLKDSLHRNQNLSSIDSSRCRHGRKPDLSAWLAKNPAPRHCRRRRPTKSLPVGSPCSNQRGTILTCRRSTTTTGVHSGFALTGKRVIRHCARLFDAYHTYLRLSLASFQKN